MSAGTNYGEDFVLNSLYGAGDLLHLHTGDPGESGTGNEVPSGAGYVATAIGGWTAPSDGVGNERVISNTNAINFPAVTASYLVTHFSISDGSGNRLSKGQLDAPRTMDASNPGQWDPGALVVGVD